MKSAKLGIAMTIVQHSFVTSKKGKLSSLRRSQHVLKFHRVYHRIVTTMDAVRNVNWNRCHKRIVSLNRWLKHKQLDWYKWICHRMEIVKTSTEWGELLIARDHARAELDSIHVSKTKELNFIQLNTKTFSLFNSHLQWHSINSKNAIAAQSV